MTNFNVHSSTVDLNGVYTASGSFADVLAPDAPITWYGQISAANAGAFTEYNGQIGGELTDNGMSNPANTSLAAIGFQAITSLALSNTNAAASAVVDTLSYSFSSPLPIGTTFYLWDPGTSYAGEASTSTFAFSGTSGTAALMPADFSIQVVYGFPGYPDIGTYATSAGTATLTVTNYKGDKQPEAIAIVTVDAPVSALTLTANTIGSDVFGLGIAAPWSAVTDTVVGAGTLVVAMPMSTTTIGAIAQGVLNTIGTAVTNGTLAAYVSGSAPTLGGAHASVQEVDAGGLVTLGSTDTAMIVDATSPVTALGGIAANESVVSALGGLTFVAGSGTGTVIAGGGTNVFISAASVAGNYAVDLAGGQNVVLAATGNDSINAGPGNNLIWLGKGADSIVSQGADTIVGQAGASTVWAGTTSDLAFGGTGGLDFIGGANTSTVVGLGGGLTVSGGSGGGFVFGGPNGGNQITAGVGKMTMYGAGTGDVLSSGSGVSGDLISGGLGAETLSGPMGNNTFFGGYGADVIDGGAGANVYVNGPGTNTMYGGAGGNTYFFVEGRQYGSATIFNFVAGRDLLSLQNYGTGAVAGVLAGATVANGDTTLTLPDDTKVTLMGVTNLSAGSFF